MRKTKQWERVRGLTSNVGMWEDFSDEGAVGVESKKVGLSTGAAGGDRKGRGLRQGHAGCV